MLVLGFLYSESKPIVEQKNAKKHVKQLRFSLNTTNTCTGGPPMPNLK